MIASIHWQRKRYKRNPTIAQIADYGYFTVCSVLAVVVQSKKLDYTIGLAQVEIDDGADWTLEVMQEE